MNRKSPQSDYRPTGRSAFFTSLVVLLMVLSACYFLLHGSRASSDRRAAAFDPQTSEDHYINIP